MLHLVTCHFCYKKIGRVHGNRVKSAIFRHWNEVHSELMADITRSQGEVRDLAQKHRELDKGKLLGVPRNHQVLIPRG